MISAISVKDRLKNQAVASGKTFQEALTAYGLERTVYRLSVSEYMERFTLKGGIFLYTDMENLVAWLMTFGAKVEVLEPAEAREIIRRNAEETLKIYGGLA